MHRHRKQASCKHPEKNILQVSCIKPATTTVCQRSCPICLGGTVSTRQGRMGSASAPAIIGWNRRPTHCTQKILMPSGGKHRKDPADTDLRQVGQFSAHLRQSEDVITPRFELSTRATPSFRRERGHDAGSNAALSNAQSSRHREFPEHDDAKDHRVRPDTHELGRNPSTSPKMRTYCPLKTSVSRHLYACGNTSNKQTRLPKVPPMWHKRRRRRRGIPST